MRRSLIHYWRVHLGLLLGAGVAATALTGALLVGDSVRGSLRDLALDRLGRIGYALTATRFFRAELATGQTAPAILHNGSARHADSGARAARVQIQGIDANFTALFPQGGSALWANLQKQPGQTFPPIAINSSLQRELGVRMGDAVLLSLARESQAHREALFGRSDDIVATLRTTVAAILPDRGPGRFGLRPHQHLPFNAYIDLGTLQGALDQRGKVNALLAAVDQPLAASQKALSRRLTPADFDLALTPTANYVAIESRRFVLTAPTAAAVATAAAEVGLRTRRYLTYLANAIVINGQSVPYSTVTALDDPAGLYLANGQPAPALAAGEIYLDAWTARNLAATPGDKVSLSYYVVGPREELSTAAARFVLKGIVQMRGLAVDRTLTPKYPGLQDEHDISAWDAPFPIDMDAIRPIDEAYWDDYGAAPKAFVSARDGERLWRSRHGALTALRLHPAPADLDPLRQSLVQRLPRGDLTFRPVRQQALAAASGATDFSGLFIGFSFFLILAAALLVVLLGKFNLEQRVREVGLLLAVGYPLAAVRRRFLAEAIILTGLGALLGLGGAQLYAHLLLVGLRTWWLEAVGTPFLHLHIHWVSLGIGFVATLLLISATLWRSIRHFHRIPARALLAAQLDTPAPKARNRAPALAACGLGLALALGMAAGSVAATAAVPLFFASGTAALLALLALFTARLRVAQSRPGSRRSMGLLNSARNPGRSALCTALIASATFVIVAVGANRRVEWQSDPGTGGFPLIAAADIPLHGDLNTTDGRFAVDLPANLHARFFPFRVLPGEDISCLNLYQPQAPRVLGAPADFITRGGFPFQRILDPTPEEETNPWLVLHRDLGPGVVPAIGDFNSTQWILHKSLGEDILISDENGDPLALRLVALVKGSLFQGELLIAEDRFTTHFPARSGYGHFLIETDAPDSLAATLEKALAPYGLDATLSAARLQTFHAIENTYLATFQTLGGLGLVLGTLGLGILLLRNALERGGELATMTACGFRRIHLTALLLYENGFLLLAGLAMGTGAALIAVAPRLFDSAPFPWASLGTSLALVLATGLLASMLAVRLALRRPLLALLKGD